MNKEKLLIKGDYVLATKYADGDPKDYWAVGFYDPVELGRYYVTHANGNQLRANGFRKVEAIPLALGKWLLDNAKKIEEGSCPVWDYIDINLDLSKPL